MNKIRMIPAPNVSRGKRSNIVWVGCIIFSAPYNKEDNNKEDMKWYCGNCDKEIEVPIKKENTICECGAYINWLSIHWLRYL